MKRESALGEFLRGRRATIEPPPDAPRFPGGYRRVPGLRREEVAHAAGVSVDYYTRIEQGRVRRPSTQILDAIGHALGLDAPEREHLHLLADASRSAAAVEVAPVPLVLRRTVETMHDIPAMMIGPRMEVIVANQGARALFGDIADPDENLARATFLNPRTRELYVDWDECARDNVGYLRWHLAHRPTDPVLRDLLAELHDASSDFRRWWTEHRVNDKTSGIKRFRHSIAGELPLSYTTLRPVDRPDLALITYSAEVGSPIDDALRMLCSWTLSDHQT